MLAGRRGSSRRSRTCRRLPRYRAGYRRGPGPAGPGSHMREAPRTDASCSRHDHGPGCSLTWRSTVAGGLLTGPRREFFARPTTMRRRSAAALPASRSPRRRPVSSLVTPPSPATSRPHGPARIQARPVFTDRRPPLSCSDWQTSPVSPTVVIPDHLLGGLLDTRPRGVPGDPRVADANPFPGHLDQVRVSRRRYGRYPSERPAFR